MVAKAKDQAASTTQDACALVRSHKESRDTESKVLPLNGIGYNLKVRKPYTIKKQRERWSEEEHLKFIEALKLYGRAWRQIEEHVGTKTAIQIRSHAQKFFAKVSRDFSTDVGGSSTPIEIPPPRPKKKPLHPYPRKIADSSKTEVLDPHQQETSNSPDVSITERDDLSPTSVLADVAEVHESRLSPTSCDTTDERSGNLLYTKKDEEHVTSNISDVMTDGSRSPMGSSVSALNDKSIMKCELFPQETEYVMSSSNAAEPLPSIKLFGKTVVVRETMKLYIEVEENSEPLPPSVINSSESNDENFVQTLASNYSYSQVDFGSVSECVTPYSLPHPLLHNGYYHMENVITLPWSTWYRGVAYPYPSSCNKTAPQNSADFPQKGLKDEESQNSAYNSGKGFVPYKRCLAEKEDNVSMSVLQKREGQRARVCS